MAGIELSAEERERYRRQLPTFGWGDKAQMRIKNSVVGIAGAGGLGSPVATYLAAAGVGRLILCDYQEVEDSNLNRQVMYSTSDIGASKALRAAAYLTALNPLVEVLPVTECLSEVNSKDIFGECHLLIDCLDNWPTRFILNHLSVEEEIPYLHGGIREHWGQFGLLMPPETACLACFLNLPEEDDEGPIPVYGAVAGIIGSMMAALALRKLGEIETVEAGKLHLLDGLSMSLEGVALNRRDDCTACGSG